MYVFFLSIHVPYAAVYFTISTGVSPSPGFPPIVPLIPEIDLISANFRFLFPAKIIVFPAFEPISGCPEVDFINGMKVVFYFENQ